MVRDFLVDLMFNRYVLYRDGGTTLGDAANYCLTEFERAAGGRDAAAKKFSIDKKVLGKLGNLTANKGGAEVKRQSVRQPILRRQSANGLKRP